MPLRVVGAGFGRTGTLSLKAALEELGFGPCHHMAEVFSNPAQLPHWQRIVTGGVPNWDEVFADYGACVDWPSAYYWRELAGHFSDAKVVLSTRDVEAWYDSFEETILRLMNATDRIPDPQIRASVEMGTVIVRDGVFGGEPENRARAIETFRAHRETVKRTIAPDRLLVFDVREGWEPLATFLGVEVPKGDFPRLNDADQFRALVGAAP